MTDSNNCDGVSGSIKDDTRRWDSVGSQLHADRPIKGLAEDLLERGAFCFSLAHAIREWKGEESLVIALFGPWGSGKSSVKNIITSLLQESEPQIPIIEFNPWSWSGEDRLVSAFFEELGAVLPTVGNHADHEALSRKWKAYAARMTLGGTALKHLKTASEFAGIPLIPMILGTLSSTAESTSTLADQVARAHEAAALDNISIQKLKEQLADELKKLKTPILVVLDDVDRLTTEEIRLLFRIVKANADFPNLVFLLLYDRRVIETALQGHAGRSGREYMDKIVQAGFDIPPPQQELLDKVLFSGLDAIIGSDPARMKFSADRWQQFYLDGLRPFFTTLRSVRRFLASFAFHVGLFYKENHLEVNVVDLIGIEVLRVFQPEVYRHLAMNRAIVFGDRFVGFGNEQEDRAAYKKLYTDWLEGAEEKYRSAVDAIARCLFPQIDWLLNNQGHGMGFEVGWLRDLRVCHSQVFDRYISLIVPTGDISQAFINQLLVAADSRTRFRDLLLQLGSPDKISAALNHFEVYAESVDLKNATEVTLALFDVGETLPHAREGLFGTSADIYACRIINEILRKESNVAIRAAVAQKCLEETTALWFPCRFVALEQPDDNEQLSPHRDVFDETTIRPAIECCANKIREAAAKNAIVGDRLAFYLWRWKEWAGNEEPRNWVAQYIEEPGNALAFIIAMTIDVHVSRGRGSGMYKRLECKDIDAFVDTTLLKAKLAPFLTATPDAEYKAKVQEHKEVIEAAKLAFATQGNPEDSANHERS